MDIRFTDGVKFCTEEWPKGPLKGTLLRAKFRPEEWTLVSPAQTAGPIEMPFELWSRVGPWNHALDGGSDLPVGKGNFDGGRGVPL